MILVNQINLIVHESFNHLGIASDKVDNLLEAKYQASTMRWSPAPSHQNCP